MARLECFGARAVFVFIVMLAAGCAVGPDYDPPVPAIGAAYSPTVQPELTVSAATARQGAAQRLVEGASPRQDWWVLFGSATLDSMVASALAANPSVAAAEAALRVAQENAAAQRGLFFPTVGVGYNFNRTRQTNAVPPAFTATPADVGPGSIYDFHTAQLTVGFTPDVFGGNRRAVESLEAQREAQEFQRLAARLTLAANVVGAAVQDALLREELQLVEGMASSGEESLRIVNRQWKAGAVSHLDVAMQETALAQTRQQLPALRKQIEQNRDLLRTLSGLPQDAQVPVFDLDRFTLPVELPLSLPAQLISQRPDVRAAEAQLHTASAQVGVARAARFPQFSISVDAGGGAQRIADLFAPAGRFYSFIAGLTQPVFDAGTLKHREGAARAAYDQAAAQYRTTVLAALQNVADAMHALHSDAEALAIAAQGAASAAAALDLTRRQYGHGYLDRVALINAEQSSRQAAMVLVQARAARLADTVALFQALGGPWKAGR